MTVTEGLQTLNAVEDLLKTRVFLHAQHAAQEHQTVVVKNPDTDVAVIASSPQPDLPRRLYFFHGGWQQNKDH